MSFILVLIDFLYKLRLLYAANSNFCSRTHRLATIHNVTDGLDRQTDRQNIKFSMNAVVYMRLRLVVLKSNNS